MRNQISGRISRAVTAPLLPFLPSMYQFRGRILLAFLFLVVASGVTLLFPLAIRPLIDANPSETTVDFDHLFINLFGLVFLQAIFGAARHYSFVSLGEYFVANLRDRLFSHLVSLDSTFYDRTHSGELLSRLAADTTQVKSAFGASVSMAFRNLFLLVGAGVMMVVTSPSLAGLSALTIPAIVMPIYFIARWIRGLSRNAQDVLAEAMARSQEWISGIRTVQAFTFEGHARRDFRRINNSVRQAALRSVAARSILIATLTLAGMGGAIIIFWYGSALVSDNRLSSGDLGQFVLYAVFATTALSALGQVWGEINHAAGSLGRIADVLRSNSTTISPTHPHALPRTIQGNLCFENVSFAYPSEPYVPVLKRVSFQIAAGEHVAIVGTSGSGKSTIFELITRVYDPSEGTIRLDGIPVESVDLEELRRQFSYIQQSATIFASSIQDNIAFGAEGRLAPDESVSAEAIASATEAAQISQFARTLPEGLDTNVGEHGSLLSGGQRQRVALARAFVRDAPVLLLDEASSALDERTESEILSRIQDTFSGRTILTISHRHSTAKAADRIIVVEGGEIAEIGRFDDLMDSGGFFARLARQPSPASSVPHTSVRS